MTEPSSARGQRGIFVTGTDTGVGKTLVATALVRLAANHGRRVVGLKPVASGAKRGAAGLRNADALELARESSFPLPYELTNPYCFEPACAPHLAASDAGVTISPAALAGWYRRASSGTDLAIVEGAGGWRVPLHPDGFLSDFPESLGMPVIMVVGLRLGCLNHARLTVEAIAATGRCPFRGWVANHVDPGFERIDDNLAALERLLGGEPLGVIPGLAPPSAASAMDYLDRRKVIDAVFPPR